MARASNRFGSDRAFGFVFAGVFALLASYSYFSKGAGSATVLAAISLCFALAGALAPRLLSLPNRLWLRFGDILHSLMSPLILLVMFWTVFVPMGLLMRLLGKRPLSLGRDPAASTYWVHRTPPGPTSDSFRNQF